MNGRAETNRNATHLCTCGKVLYRHKGTAKQARHDLICRHGDSEDHPLDVYRCRTGGKGWHVGHLPLEQAQARRGL